MKTCKVCKELKGFEQFSVDKHNATGRWHTCKSCHSLQGRAKRKNPLFLKEMYEKNAIWRKEKRTHLATYKRERRKDPQYRQRCNLNAVVHHALRKPVTRGTNYRLLGCTGEAFRYYLESKFTSEMSWENRAVIWEIDHIRPLSTFDLTNEHERMAASHYSNLRPLLRMLNKPRKYA